jgi:hypothetical protein
MTCRNCDRDNLLNGSWKLDRGSAYGSIPGDMVILLNRPDISYASLIFLAGIDRIIICISSSAFSNC